MKLIQKDFMINVSGEQRQVDLYLNEEGNLVFNGLGLVNYEMFEEELVLMKVRKERILMEV